MYRIIGTAYLYRRRRNMYLYILFITHTHTPMFIIYRKTNSKSY